MFEIWFYQKIKDSFIEMIAFQIMPSFQVMLKNENQSKGKETT